MNTAYYRALQLGGSLIFVGTVDAASFVDIVSAVALFFVSTDIMRWLASRYDL